MGSKRRFSRVLPFLLLLSLLSCNPTPEKPISDADSSPTVAQASRTPTLEPDQAPSPTPTPSPIPRTEVDDPAGLVFYNGTVLTMELDNPQVEAIAILGDRIQAVGSDQEILALAGDETQLIDLNGRTLTPGFIDSHSHRIPQRHKWGFSTPEEAVQAALEQGWTGLDSLAVPQHDLDEFIDLDARGELRLRLNAYLMINTFGGEPLGDWFYAYEPGQQFSPSLRVAGLKIFIDYDSGRTFFFDQEELNQIVQRLHSEGWQISMKAVSIQSHELALNALEYALNGESNDFYRHRLEHSIAVTDEQLARMARLGIIACIQPSFPGVLSYDPDSYRMAEENGYDNSYRWRDYYEGGVFMIASPLNPTGVYDELTSPTHISPTGLFYRSVTQIGVEGRQPDAWMLEKTLTVEQILPLITINGAYTTFEEDLKGSLAPGKYADLVILSENPLTAPVENLPHIVALMTMVGGKVEWCAAGAQALCPSDIGLATADAQDLLVIPSGDPIRIAFVGPSSGQHAVLLPAMLETAQIALEEHGPIHGFEVDLAPFDDACSEQGGLEVADEISATDGFTAILGPMCSSSARAGLPAYEEAQLALVSPSVDDPDLPAFGPAVFNRVFFDQDQLAAMGKDEDYVNDLPQAQVLFDAYQARTGSQPPEAYKHYLAYGYDAFGILLDALVRVAELKDDGSLAIPREALAQAIRATSAYEGVTGRISLDAQGNRIP
jgi:predicted amidohydrolase YtcJ